MDFKKERNQVEGRGVLQSDARIMPSTSEVRSGGDHDHGANLGRASKEVRSRSVLAAAVFTAISPPTLESLQARAWFRRLRFEGAVTHLPPGLCLKRHMQPSQVPSPLDFLRKFLILFLQPFCQGVSTRLPFIYYVIHLDAHFGKQITDTFGSKWFPIGCFVAAFQVK